MIKGLTDISLDLKSPMYSPYHINSRLRLQLNAHNQELSGGTVNTLASRGPSFAFTEWLEDAKYSLSAPHVNLL